MKLKYNHLSELPILVEKAIAEVDVKVAKHNEEIEVLNKQRRELKASLGGEGRKPARKVEEAASVTA